MYQQHHYQHPDLEPFSRAIWKEVIYSWAIALAVFSVVMASL